MVVTKKEIQYAVGIEDLYICMMAGTETTAAKPTYEEEVYAMTNITDLSIAAEIAAYEKDASNKKIVNVVKTSKYVLSFNLAGMPRDVKDMMLGKTREKGISFERAVAAEYPKFALGIVAPLSDGTRVGRWYLRCTLAPLQESFKTQGTDISIDDVAYVITADPLLYNDVTIAEIDTGHETATGVTIADYMKQVVCDEAELATLFP